MPAPRDSLPAFAADTVDHDIDAAIACKFSYLVTDINLAFIDRMVGTELFCRRKLILALVLTMTSLHIDNRQLQGGVANPSVRFFLVGPPNLRLDR